MKRVLSFIFLGLVVLSLSGCGTTVSSEEVNRVESILNK